MPFSYDSLMPLMNILPANPFLAIPSIILGCIFLTILVLHVGYLLRKPGPGPALTLNLPGPPGLPIIGNLHQVGSNWSETFRKWKNTYGEVYAVRLGERDVVVINSPRAAKELFIDQGSAYISRPWFHTFHNVLSGKGSSAFTIGTSPWDDSCKQRRRAAATALNKPCVQSYTPIIEMEALALLKDLVAHGAKGVNPIDPYRYFQRLALNTSLFVNYGTRMADIEDDLFAEIANVTHKIAGVRAVTGSMQDFLPLLRLAPKSWSRKNDEAVELAARRKRYMDKLLDDLITRIDKNTDIPCITGNILRDPGNKLERKEIMSICMSMVSAGLDTFANTMIWTTGLLALRPDLQQRAYEDLLSSHSNAPPDPYLEKSTYILALAKEASRYFNVFRLSLPRNTVSDSEWRGHKIPKGTTIFLNAWACNMDEEVYGDSEVFRPERFLGEEQEKDANLGPSTYAFGLGRRMCPGIHLAMREMYVTLAYLIYYFRIERVADSESEGHLDINVDPVTAIENPQGFSMCPKRFKVRFVPREENLAVLGKVLAQGSTIIAEGVPED